MTEKIDQNTLREQIARALFSIDPDRPSWENATARMRAFYLERADAVMPLVSTALAVVEAERDARPFPSDAERIKRERNRLRDDVNNFWKPRAHSLIAERDAARTDGYVEGIHAAQRELVALDQFSSRTLDILDELIAACREGRTP